MKGMKAKGFADFRALWTASILATLVLDRAPESSKPLRTGT